jgi:hypothetical protein
MENAIKIFYLLLTINIFNFQGRCAFPEGIDRPPVSIDSKESMAYLPKHLAVVKINFRNVAIQQATPIYGSMNGNTLNYTIGPERSIETTTNAGKYVFEFYYNSNHYEIKSDSIHLEGGTKTHISIYFQSSSPNQLMKKPVIYYYGKNDDSVTIELNIQGDLSFTYPAYSGAWKFKSDSIGNIMLKNKTYPYLFWEGNCSLPPFDIDHIEGSYIQKANLITFLETNLEIMGLTRKEATDFITYWAPQMQKHEEVFIHFYFKETIDSFAELTITPEPESIFRVYMLWQVSDYRYYSNKPQQIPTFQRKGTTLVEWGGTEMKP